MDVNGMISSLSPQSISSMKQAAVQSDAAVTVAKKAIDVQKASGEALIKVMQENATHTGKGVNLDKLV